MENSDQTLSDADQLQQQQQQQQSSSQQKPASSPTSPLKKPVLQTLDEFVPVKKPTFKKTTVSTSTMENEQTKKPTPLSSPVTGTMKPAKSFEIGKMMYSLAFYKSP
ncbi:unnamed protein product [Mucor hiemalis]